MDSRNGKMRMNVEDDRLSSLPDELIHKILSFVGTKQAVETSALSSRWRYIWTSMPSLNLSSEDFRPLPKLSKFITHVLSGRNNQIEVSYVKLTIDRRVSQSFIKNNFNKILNYAFYHNVQHLNFNYGLYGLYGKKNECPLSLLRSQSLKHLTLACLEHKDSITTPPTWEFLALATLNLRCVTLYNDNTDKSAGLFSNCPNLKNLTIKHCRFIGWKIFNICHPGLSNLTLDDCYEGVNVVTPQLKNLTIILCSRVHVVSAPNLASLRYEAYYVSLKLPAELLHLEKVDICILHARDDKSDAHKVVSLLQQLHSIKFLTLNLEIIKILCSSEELISHQPSTFSNLKSLKIYPFKPNHEEQTQPKVTLCAEVKNYLQGFISHEDIRAMYNTELTQDLITKLGKLLEQEKASTETIMAKMHEQGKAQVDFNMCWKYLSVHIEKGKEKASNIISKLKEIKELLGELPASNRAITQPSFSSLCAEAEIVMNKITDCMKMQCDENQRSLGVCFHELATTSQPSS